MAKLEIQKEIFSVGAVDWNVRNFHGHTYTTKRGTTYNSYLILDEKAALVDTVYTPFAQELAENINEIIPPGKIDYIIANHVEVDHSGALPHILKLCPKAKVFGTQKCKEGLYRHYYTDMDFQVVKTGDKLNLGKRDLTFIEAPMIHWPDSMFTYLDQKEILFSNDAFGQHYASQERFDDEVDFGLIMNENAKYYANILWPFSSIILRKLKEIQELNLPIKMILTSHGLNWRAYPDKAIESYLSWSRGEAKERIIIAYDTMYYSSEKMASAILEGITSEGVRAEIYRIPISDLSDIIKELLETKGLLVGSSTVNNHILPTVAKFLAELKSLKPLNKIGSFFGSYGWNNDMSSKELETEIKESGIKMALPPLNIRYAPSPNELKQCFEFGKNFALEIKK